MKRILIDWFYEVKYFFQRVFRSSHSSDRDIFELFPRLAEIILPKLKAFRKHTYGYPADFTDDDDGYKGPIGGGFDKWIEYLDEMIFAFEFIMADECCGKKEERKFKKKYGDWNAKIEANKKTTDYHKPFTYYWDDKMYEAMQERCNKGLKLFGEYFRALWF